MTPAFTTVDLDYLRSQRLGRLATIDAQGVPQNNPVGFVVDDLVSTNPWTVRGIEVRGRARALVDVEPPVPYMSRELIRITPDWIGSWGSPLTRLA